MSPSERKELNQAFYKLGTWQTTKFRGVPLLKYPCDIWVYQEIIEECQPKLIIELGTFHGASAAWFASRPGVLKVITVDIEAQVQPQDKAYKVEYLIGDSTSKPIIEKVKQLAKGFDSVMVVLDSDHSALHVMKELESYYSLVTPYQYLVVEDTALGFFETNELDYPAGSVWHALSPWLERHPEFVPDRNREKFVITMNPNGWLKRT